MYLPQNKIIGFTFLRSFHTLGNCIHWESIYSKGIISDLRLGDLREAEEERSENGDK